MKLITIVGILLALLGIGTLAFPAFKTSNKKEIAKLGDVTIDNRENVLHVIPPAASISAILVGGGLIVAGIASRNRD
jgi:hypothetical protein